jgi:hypothetical protein
VRVRPLVVASLVVTLPVVLGACGSTSSGGDRGAASAPAGFCQKALAVLSDGPDPDADPVGYAQSQIIPLGDIHTSNTTLSAALAKLIAADRALVTSEGSDHAAVQAIAKANATLNTYCPGVAS